MSKDKNKKVILEMLKKIYPRIGFEGFLYFEICSEAYTLVKRARTEIHERQPKDGSVPKFDLKITDLLREIGKQENVAIAFAALCLEACIWDYAGCKMSHKKVTDNFGSLNLVGKWVLIPQLLCDSDITKVRIGDTSLLGKLRELKNARNELVHPKSKPIPDNFTDAFEALGAEAERRRIIAVEDAFGLIGLLLGELEKVDKTNWWFFQTARYKDSIKKLHESSASSRKQL